MVTRSSRNLGRVLDALGGRPANRYRRRRPDVGWSGRPSAPTMITVVLAVALTVVGLSLTEMPIEAINRFIADQGWEITRDQAYLALVASPLLLVAGSFMRGM